MINKFSSSTDRKNSFIAKLNLQKYGMFIALIVIAIFFQIVTDGILLMPANVSKLILQNSYILILAIGMLPCILTGDIDLSVGSVVGFIGAVVGVLFVQKQMPVIVVILIALGLGALVGAFHGFWIAYVRVPAFIATLAGMLLFRGITYAILDGNTLSQFPESYKNISSGFIPELISTDGSYTTTIVIGGIVCILFMAVQIKNRIASKQYGLLSDTVSSKVFFLLKLILISAVVMVFAYWLSQYKGMPTVLILLAGLILIYSFITNKTVLGRHIYALGGNEKASQLSGIKTKRVKFFVYVNMGILSALAGIVFTGRLNAAPPSAGNGFELDAIAACFIGGASASGGIGSIVGAIVGGLVMGILNNGMSIMGIESDWQQVVKGSVLLLAVAFDMYNRSKKR